MTVKDRNQPVRLGRGIFARCENRVYYHRRKALARYYEQRLLIIAELGGKCAECDTDTALQVIKKPDALLPFRVCELFSMARRRLPYHLAECFLACTTHANKAKFGHRLVTHGRYYACFQMKCRCDECEEFRVDYALRRREDRRKNRKLPVTGSVESVYLSKSTSINSMGMSNDTSSNSPRS